ncbi:MAG: hypothetical protein WCK02_07035 [Bacteroidota bacterium]
MKKFIKSISLLFFIIIFSCTHSDIEVKYKKLLAENDSLKKILEPINQKQLAEKANSKGLVFNEKISIEELQTGFQYEGMFIPCVLIKLKNISNMDIQEYVKVQVIFIDNSKKEQIGETHKYLASPDEKLLQGYSKRLSFLSSIGWFAVQNQDVTANIFINDVLIKTINIKRKQLSGLM